jgi:hypothetical protein
MNCYSSEDGRYIEFSSFKAIKDFVQINGKPKDAYYYSSEKIFVVVLHYIYSSKLDKHENEYAQNQIVVYDDDKLTDMLLHKLFRVIVSINNEY